MDRNYYHTQESREVKLSEPIICSKSNAWLGNGYYFWYYIDDAHKWGKTSKRKTGRYEIYKSKIEVNDKVLDTVFNEDHYNWWVGIIEQYAKKFIKKFNLKPTIADLNQYIKEKANIYEDIDAVQFQDFSTDSTESVIKPIQNLRNNKLQPFVYRKRIQIAVYNLEIISTFALDFEGQVD
ncbi:MAG: hypothetical protein IPN73_13360 [Saprospiraceae bacterium]|nr:hypothetical protein [Saprospiraceae bacterium]